ncbi:hypothetical protein SLE2022_092520 [Rubroshorea leprosula]
MAKLSAVFSVKRQEPELVPPAKPTPRESKYLSDIDDQDSLRFQFPFIMFYPDHPSLQGKDPAMVIKDALSKALVHYYPFAGRLREGPNRKLVVDCTGEGVLFIEADADIRLDQLGDTIRPPFPCCEDLLFDVPGSSNALGCPLLLIQVTRLKCGGFIFAVRLNHVMADSLGLVQFLNSVAEIAKGADKPSVLPVWKREIFTARDPPQVTCQHDTYNKLTHTTGSKVINMDSDYNLVQKCFFFSQKDIRSIRSHLPPHLSTSSTFEVLTACIWRSRTVALDHNPDEIVSVSCPVTARGKQGMQVPHGFYGNAFAYVAAVSSAKLLCENPLGYALELVKRTKTRMSEEYMKSLADLMVIKGRPKCDTTARSLLVADTTKVGFEKVDFGWGEAVYGGPIGSIDFTVCYANARCRNSKGERGVVMPVWLPPVAMERFEQEIEKMTRQAIDVSYDKKYERITSML